MDSLDVRPIRSNLGRIWSQAIWTALDFAVRQVRTRLRGGVTVLTVLAVVSVVAAAVQVSTSSSRDEARIRALIADEESAWNRGDAAEYAAHFDQNGSFTNVVGTVVYGRKAFEDRHRGCNRRISARNIAGDGLGLYDYHGKAICSD